MRVTMAGACGATTAFVLLLSVAPVRADQTSIGVTVNGTVGHHVESDRTQAIPFLPLPAFELEHVHRAFHIHLEAVPPIGPVPLDQSNTWTESLAPRVSYLNGEILYASPIVPIEAGIGETVLNQETVEQIPWPQPGSHLHYSRVAGIRLALRAHLWKRGPSSIDASLAANPSMHGLQDGIYSEYASLVDASLRWTRNIGRYDLLYGVRYWNYTAAYSATNRLGDRNHLFMPFLGIDWHRAYREPSPGFARGATSPAALRGQRGSIGVTLLGTNGNRTFTQASSDTPLNFQLLPDVVASYAAHPYEVDGEAILPSASSNPFGSPSRWSYVSIDVLREAGKSGIDLGVGETVTNLRPIDPGPYVQAHTRSAALDLVGRLPIERTPAATTLVQLRVNPYVHVWSWSSYSGPGQSGSSQSTAHGARVDASLERRVDVGHLQATYGLRYINQTTNYFSRPGFAYLTRSTSLMPFAGLTVPFGRL